MEKKFNSFYSVAPMMGKTDSFFCYLMYLINKNIKVYTEMMHANTILRTNILEKYKGLDDLSNIAIQIAGNSPIYLAKAAKKASAYGFKEININCGCPSKNVIAGNFGLSLLLKPKIVKDCVEAVKSEVSSLVSVKTRIGIHNNDDNNQILDNFINEINLSGVKKYILHARNGMLGNISTKKNLKIPPLKYERVFKLKEKFYKNIIIINGGFVDTLTKNTYQHKIDGIMIGREAYKNPWIFNSDLSKIEDKLKIVLKYIEYLKKKSANCSLDKNSLFHLQNVFYNSAGAKKWRKVINETIKNNDLQILLNYIK